MVAAVKPRFSLVETLSPGPFTVFAPTKTAFAACQPERLVATQAENKAMLSGILIPRGGRQG
jgi:uncharacterized surface protein with fasciclin (FAS1) repeats